MFWIWTTWTTAISLESKTASCQRMDNRNPANLRCYRGGRQWAGIFRPFVFVCRPGECPKGSRHRPFTTTAVRTPIAVISRQGERGDNQNPFHGKRYRATTQLRLASRRTVRSDFFRRGNCDAFVEIDEQLVLCRYYDGRAV
ncbi:uncharacterized protein LOC143143720 isoform X5 [Ptiloglossa arizonensis]|uniref:uncharacterized protein LOC143143720 isoform X5 n=1 Tax=Ptiloglossa arizonensis TaxID=3350558 RepID=UPI003F9F8F36